MVLSNSSPFIDIFLNSEKTSFSILLSIFSFSQIPDLLSKEQLIKNKKKIITKINLIF